jgi:hypothetical protein
MGIFINLDIIPHKIGIKEWKNVYYEALKLVNAYPFMDKLTNRDLYNCAWVYVDKTRERKMESFDNEIGFNIIGDMVTMKIGEHFSIVKNIKYYQSLTEPKASSEDILIEIASEKCNKYSKKCEGAIRIFESKTLGYDYHKYVLAIACLIESRFPMYAAVSGDISRGQIIESIEWANSVLENPISMIQRYDNEILLYRINSIESDSKMILEIFINENINELDLRLGNFIRANFEKVDITKYFSDKIIEYDTGTIGFKRFINNYFNMGFGLDELCEIFINNYKNFKSKIKEFIADIMSLNMHIEDYEKRQKLKNIKDITMVNSRNPQSKVPDTIWTLFNKFAMVMNSGLINQSDRYIPLDDITSTIKEKFHEIDDINNIINSIYNPAKNDKRIASVNVNKLLEKIDNEKLGQQDKQKQQLKEQIKKKGNELIKINSIDELILWDGKVKLSDELRNIINDFKVYINKCIKRNDINYIKFKKMNNKEKIEYLVTCSEYFYISLDGWNYIINNVENDKVISRIFYILNISADEMYVNQLCKAIMNNNNLFRNIFAEIIC